MHRGCITTVAIGSKAAEEATGAALLSPLATTSRPAINGARIGIVFSSSRTELVLQRQLPNSPAGRCEDRVGQRGGRDRSARFADSPGLFEVAHQVHLD